MLRYCYFKKGLCNVDIHFKKASKIDLSQTLRAYNSVLAFTVCDHEVVLIVPIGVVGHPDAVSVLRWFIVGKRWGTKGWLGEQ